MQSSSSAQLRVRVRYLESLARLADKTRAMHLVSCSYLIMHPTTAWGLMVSSHKTARI